MQELSTVRFRVDLWIPHCQGGLPAVPVFVRALLARAARVGAGLAGPVLVMALLASFFPSGSSGSVPSAAWEAGEHECHLFGYLFSQGAGSEEILSNLCQDLYEKTLPLRATHTSQGGGWRESPSRDGWGFAYFLAPRHPGIMRPILIKSGAAASDDDARWNAARDEIAIFALQGPSVVVGHVRKSSYGPDDGALPDPHPFSDSLMGRWWHFAHNGHMKPDTLMPWIPDEFLAGHALDYEPVRVDSEVLFRYCQYEIERLGSVREGLLLAFHRVKGYEDFLFNTTLTDGDTLWAAHTHDSVPFYFDAAPDSSAWWVSTVQGEGDPAQMEADHLYWFTSGGMGVASYE